jgi:hypothetical protein|tara:strand:+ start:1097 stop:1612 length:516 start_codon:yes stop_codon:yes gene_type:complete
MIKIVDNFFSENDLKFIQNFALNKAFYTPCFFNNAPEKSKQYFYGNRFYLNNEPKIKNLMINQSQIKFLIKNLKLNSKSGIDQRNLDHFKPHVDYEIPGDPIINILIMISGPTAVTNGTVFYSDGELDMHVGFKENRAVMFPSNIFHSSHASNVPNLKRYTATLFCTSYEE